MADAVSAQQEPVFGGLPVVLTVGDVTAEVGRLTLDAGETVQDVLPLLLRATADAIERVPVDERPRRWFNESTTRGFN